MTVKLKRESLYWTGRKNTIIHKHEKREERNEGMFLPLNNGRDVQKLFHIRLECQLY
jgi:hypothetical protein